MKFRYKNEHDRWEWDPLAASLYHWYVPMLLAALPVAVAWVVSL